MNSKMLFYILKRVLLALLTIWIVITVTFFVMHSIPGGPFASEKAISAEAQAALEAKYGLDKPLGEQYVTYLRDVVTKLDFGPSLKQRGRQVIDIILDHEDLREAWSDCGVQRGDCRHRPRRVGGAAAQHRTG